MGVGNLNSIMDAHKIGDPAQREMRITSAYAALFSGNGTKDDADLVLVDLAMHSRYYDTANLSDDPAASAAATQRRAVFQRIMDGMALGGREPQGLLQAVLTAPPTETEENVS